MNIGAVREAVVTKPNDNPRRRGRPSLGEVKSISRNIMDAARTLFIEEKFENVSLEAIAARAGVKKNTIYKRFPDKRMLLRGLLMEQRAAWSLEYGQPAPVGDLVEDLRFYAVRLLRHGTSPDIRTWSRLAESAWPGLEEIKERRIALGYDRAVDLFANIMRKHATDDGPVTDPEFVANALVSILASWTDIKACELEIREDELIAFAHSAVKLILHGRSAW